VATRVLSNIGDDIHSYFKNKSGEALKKKRNKKISEQKNVLSQPEPITAKFIIKVQENEAIGWFEGNNAEALGEAFKNAPQMFINFPQKLQLDNVQTTKVSPLYISSDDKKQDTYKYDVSKGLWLPKD
jgi:hypothetical protein